MDEASAELSSTEDNPRVLVQERIIVERFSSSAPNS